MKTTSTFQKLLHSVSFFPRRKKIFKFGSSTFIFLRFGVFQGSVLRPLHYFFNTFFISGIIQKHNVLYHQFADNSTLFTRASYLDPHSSLTKIFQSITKLNFWFSYNSFMSICKKKETMFVDNSILFSESNLFTEVTFDGTTPSVTSKFKILGLTFGPSHKFTHFQTILAPNFHFYVIKQVRKFLPFSTAVASTISIPVLTRLLQLLTLRTSELFHIQSHI